MVGAPGSDAGGVDSGSVTVVFGVTGFSLYDDAVPNTPGRRRVFGDDDNQTLMALNDAGFSAHRLGRLERLWR